MTTTTTTTKAAAVLDETAAVVDLKAAPPPTKWGVTVNEDAIALLAERWKNDTFALPSFDYPGVPAVRDESWWFDYVVLAVSVLACLWPPDDSDGVMWKTHIESTGAWLDDAPGLFAAFARKLGPQGMDLGYFANLTESQGQDLFQGVGTLQMIPQRVQILRGVATGLMEEWEGSARNLVETAGRHGKKIAGLLATTIPIGFADRWVVEGIGELRLDKLAHLAASFMAAGMGWHAAGFSGYELFPMYPDYMLPRVFRHTGIMKYAPDLAARVDARQLIAAGSPEELALRWATVYAGDRLLTALQARGNAVTAPALDYRLWYEAVLGPEAATFVNWDGVGAPFVMPPDFFHINVPRGLEMVPVNAYQTFLLSNDSNGLDDKFDSINPTAAADFITFSPERLFASHGASTLKMIFHEAGSGEGAEQALTNGFGAVFVDVELPGQTKVVAKDTNGCVIAEAYALPQNGGLSYVGIFVGENIIDSIEIQIPSAIDDGPGGRRLGKKGKSGKMNGNSGKGGGRNGRARSSIQDFVVMDDFSYGEPTNPGNGQP